MAASWDKNPLEAAIPEEKESAEYLQHNLGSRPQRSPF